MQEKYGRRGVVFNDGCPECHAENMAATVKEKGMRYPVAADVAGQMVAAGKLDGFLIAMQPP